MGQRQCSMEDLVMMECFANSYRGRRVLITGHTGFKGSWLALWLSELGARVTGMALDVPSHPAHWDVLSLPCEDVRLDVRDYPALLAQLERTRPEVVFHLAAQSLVRRSYRRPLETWSANVMGTANLLEACRQVGSVRAVVVVTSDKCYENREWEWGYRETDRFGGHDPYSASKGASELVVASYRNSYFSHGSAPLLASGRAGNVIGGGDWAEDRLIPDVVRSMESSVPLIIRSPMATRPWQHVLEPLTGYLLLGQHLLEGGGEFAEGWNFGPATEGNRTVSEVLSAMRSHWSAIDWRLAEQMDTHEANLLYLDSAKARKRLKWQPVWGFDRAIEQTARWYKAYVERGEVVSRAQLEAFVADARAAGIAWSDG